MGAKVTLELDVLTAVDCRAVLIYSNSSIMAPNGLLDRNYRPYMTRIRKIRSSKGRLP